MIWSKMFRFILILALQIQISTTIFLQSNWIHSNALHLNSLMFWQIFFKTSFPKELIIVNKLAASCEGSWQNQITDKLNRAYCLITRLIIRRRLSKLMLMKIKNSNKDTQRWAWKHPGKSRTHPSETNKLQKNTSQNIRLLKVSTKLS